MGVYLTKPNTDKQYESATIKGLSWGAIAMQGSNFI